MVEIICCLLTNFPGIPKLHSLKGLNLVMLLIILSRFLPDMVFLMHYDQIIDRSLVQQNLLYFQNITDLGMKPVALDFHRLMARLKDVLSPEEV